MSSRLIATSSVVAAAAVVAALGVTWAQEAPTPDLERTSQAVLFDGVGLEPGVPVERCSGIVPRGSGLVAVGLHGQATGGLSSAVTIRVERGAGATADPTDCREFVPLATVYEGRLDTLPPETAPSTTPVAIERDRPVAYRTTLTLPRPAAGSTRFALMITGYFADIPVPPAPPPSPDPEPQPGPGPEAAPGPEPDSTPRPPAAEPCLQLQSGRRVERSNRDGAVRVVVRVPQALPVQLVRPLPVYVSTRRGVRPTVTAGPYAVRMKRTVGGRWVGHVPVAALRRSATVRVGVGRASVTVPVRTRPCTARVRTFLRADETLDLRVDTPQALSGLRIRIPSVLGRPSSGRLAVGAVDERGRTRSSRGKVTSRGSAPTDRVPRIKISGRTIEVLDVPAGVRTLSLRLRVRRSARAYRATCRGAHLSVGYVAVTGSEGPQRDDVRSPLKLIGERCPRR